MSSGIKSSQRDMTGNFRPVGIGSADMRRAWLCGHKSHSGKKRAGLLWKCAKCVVNQREVVPRLGRQQKKPGGSRA